MESWDTLNFCRAEEDNWQKKNIYMFINLYTINNALTFPLAGIQL